METPTHPPPPSHLLSEATKLLSGLMAKVWSRYTHRTLDVLETFPRNNRCFSQTMADYLEKIILHVARSWVALP